MQLAEAGVRARTHPAQVVADLGEAHGDDAQCPGCLDEAVAGTLRLEVVERLGDGQPGVLGEGGDDELGEAGRGVDAGADRGSAERDLGDAHDGRGDALDAEANLPGVAGEFLAEGHGGGVHEVGAAGLDGGLPQVGLGLERAGEMVERGDQVVQQRTGDGHVHRGGEYIVGRLRGVDVVIGVHGRAEQSRRERREHLVHVHVRRGAAAGLVGVDRELLVVLAGDQAVGGASDGVGDGGVQDAEFLVHERGGALDSGERDDLGRLQPGTRDREVLDGTLRLRTIQRGDRHEHLTHRVVLHAELVAVMRLGGVAHDGTPSWLLMVRLPTWMSGTARPSRRR